MIFYIVYFTNIGMEDPVIRTLYKETEDGFRVIKIHKSGNIRIDIWTEPEAVALNNGVIKDVAGGDSTFVKNILNEFKK